MFKRLEQSPLLVSSQKIELLADKQLLPNEAAHQLYHVTLCISLQTVLIFDVLGFNKGRGNWVTAESYDDCSATLKARRPVLSISPLQCTSSQ